MAAREYSSPEEWANHRADKLAKRVRRKAESSRYKLPRGSAIGADMILKTARRIWELLSAHNSGTIDREVEKAVLTWAAEPYPTYPGERLRVRGFSGKVPKHPR